MKLYIARRVGQSIVTILLVTVIIFIAVRIVGDPTDIMLPPEATKADRAVLREQLGISEPVLVQYARFLRALAKGDLGSSYRYNQPAVEVLRASVGPTLILTFTSLGIALLVGIPLGIGGAVWRGGWIDRAGVVVSVIGQAAPPFLFGLLFARFFGVGFGWFPTSGYGTFGHLIMPAIALGWYSLAGIVRLTRSGMVEALGSEYVRMARIKGLSEVSVVCRHAFRNALLPLLTFTGVQLGILLGGAVSIEAVFAWPGIGKLMLDSINNLDFTVVQAAVLLAACTFTAINLAVDILYACIDPRIRYA